MPCPAHPYHHLKYTDLHINLQRQEFQAGLEGGKDSWEKKKIERGGSCCSIWKSHYVGSPQLHLVLASALIS